MSSSRVIGLTGGIACGKSTIASMLTELGAVIVDADRVARDVVEPGKPALLAIRDRFGAEVLAKNGSLDRGKLGRIVFGNREAREALNAIIHPRIAVESQRQLQTLAARGHDPVLYEAPLLIENRLHLAMAGVIVVSLPEGEQLARLMKRDGIDAHAAQARIDSQLPLENKLEVADWVIDNSGDPAATRVRVKEVWEELSS